MPHARSRHNWCFHHGDGLVWRADWPPLRRDRLGFEYGTLGRELVNRHGYDAYEAKTLPPLDQLSVWTQPLSYTIECAKACFTSAVTHGDMTMACFAACHQIINFLSGATI